MSIARVFPLALGALCACYSADSWRKDADQEVEGILSETRAALGAKEEFRLERPADSLRARLVAARTDGSPQALTLDLVGCLEVAGENSRDWQDQREALFRSALDLTLQRWNFSVKEEGTASAGLDGARNGSDSDGFLSNLKLVKLLGIGTQITANIGLDMLKDLGRGDAWSALSHLSLNITQPILRGLGSDIVKEPLTQAERDVLYQARAYERFRRTFAVNVAQSFFRVLEQVDRLKNEQANYETLVDLRERNEALAEAGRLTDIQVDQARQDELSAQDRLVEARRALDRALDDFKFLLGLPIETELTLDEGGQRSMEAWKVLARTLDEGTVVRTGLENRLDHRTVLDRQADAERGARVAADALRMGLNLTAGSSANGPSNRPADFRTGDVSGNVGLDLDLPIDKIPERNAYRSALIARASSLRDVEESGDRVTSELRDALRNLEAARRSFDIQSGSVVLAQRRVESANLNLEAGRASTRDVLEAQNSLLDAQNALAAALTDTILAGLALYRDMERLEVTEHGIEVLELAAAEEHAPAPGEEHAQP